MIEIEMGNRGSKSDPSLRGREGEYPSTAPLFFLLLKKQRGYIENIYMGSVKEQRVDGSSAARYNI